MMSQNNNTLYIKCYNGKLVKVTEIFTSVDEANEFMKANPGEGLIDTINNKYFLIANCNDLGE